MKFSIRSHRCPWKSWFRLRVTVFTGDTIFLDSNIVIYFFREEMGRGLEDFVNKIKYGEITGAINSTVLSEVFHKLVVLDICERQSCNQSEAVRKLKEDPGLFKTLKRPYRSCEELLDWDGLKPFAVKNLKEVVKLSKENQLFISDAIHAMTCKENAIEDIATNDTDFERVEFLRIWKP